MSKHLKKAVFLGAVSRLCSGEKDAWLESMPLRDTDYAGDEKIPALSVPFDWSSEAAEVMSEAACATIPARLIPVEENTVPSWLWRHRGDGAAVTTENDARALFNRVVGSAAAHGWALGLFSSERPARAFYDELMHALLRRHSAIAPHILAEMGLHWAYGLQTAKRPAATAAVNNPQALSNKDIEQMLAQKKPAPRSKNLAPAGADDRLNLRFATIAADWRSAAATPAAAAIDVLALRHNDGSVNIEALCQAARLLVILLDLHDRADVAIGLANLSPLLMALSLAYDSEAGRAQAATIAAIVTGACYLASAEMAALRGASAAFLADRDAILRNLRNHCRAAYGDGDDYEKLSVAPAPLAVKNCPDLALAAAAQQIWQQVIEQATHFGLRAIHVTDLTPSPVLAIMTECAAQGAQPIGSLIATKRDADNTPRSILHTAAAEALHRLHYARSTVNALEHHVAGHGALAKASALSHSALRARGLNDATIAKIEAYLPSVNDVRLAITPWIIGVDICRADLKIPACHLQAPHFNLLKHLGFNDAEIEAANLFCYGHGTARHARMLNIRHRTLFLTSTETTPEAQLRMAAALQAFVSGDVGLTVPIVNAAEQRQKLILTAWQAGLKSLTLVVNKAADAAGKHRAVPAARRLTPLSQPQGKAFKSLSPRRKAPPLPPVLFGKHKHVIHKSRG